MDKLYEKISKDIQDAMYSKDEILLNTLRGIKKELLEKKKSKTSKGIVTEETAIRIMQKMVKQRTESTEIYRENNRPDLLEIEEAEIRIINKYIPDLMPESDIKQKILKIIGQTGVTKISQIGTLLKAVMPVFEGKADRQLVAKMSRELLSAYEKAIESKK